MNNLPVSNLDFDGIKSDLKQFIKDTGKYNDIDFESSGISTIINLLAYNTHYISYYVKMLMNESFIDSAVLRPSLLSKAKLTGYTPKNLRAAKATIAVTSYITPLEYQRLNGNNMVVEQYSKFLARNQSGVLKQFINLDEYDYNYTSFNGTTYYYQSPNIVLTEGVLVENDFTVTNPATNRFIIHDRNIDIDSIRVFVKDNANALPVEYKRVTELFDIDGTSQIYFISTSELGEYEIIFGNDVFGKALKNNNVVLIKSISCSGVDANDSTNFVRQGTATNPYDYSNFTHNTEVIIDKASGGLNQESIEELRYNIPKFNGRQNRLVSTDDFRSFILSEYRDISSISVYGGEDTFPKEFGKINITIKPKYSNTLSFFAKQEILNKIQKIKIIGSEIIFNDPKYINIELVVNVKLQSDNIRNPLETKTNITSIINDYNLNILNRFDVSYSDIELLSRIKKQTQSVFTLYTRKNISFSFDIIHGNTNEVIINFGSANTLTPGTLSSDVIYYNEMASYLSDEISLVDAKLGDIYLVDLNGTRISDLKFGSINYSTSIIKLNPDLSFRSSDIHATYDSYRMIITPVSQDVFSFNDTLVNISNINVVLQ